MLRHPARVHAGVIRDHVAGKPYPAAPRALFQCLQPPLAAQLPCNDVVEQGVRGCLCLGISHPALDLAGGAAALPDPDQPQGRETGARQPIQLLVGHLVQAPDLASPRPRELVQPHQRVLGDHHRPGHPVAVFAEGLHLGCLADIFVYLREVRE